MPNQYTNREGLGQKQIVLEFVQAHPQCTTADILASVKFGNSASIGNYLTKLANAGHVYCVKLPGHKLLKWSAVEKDEDDAPVRVVRQWWSGECQRDVLVAALFGPA